MDNKEYFMAGEPLTTEKITAFELSMSQQLLLENFSRGIKDTDPEWVQAMAIDLYRQLLIHKNLFAAHLKGEF